MGTESISVEVQWYTKDVMSYSTMATAATSTSSFNIKKLGILPAKCMRLFMILTVKIYYFYK